MSLTPKIKILLVDDHQLFNDGLKSLLSSETNLEVVGQIFEGKNVLFAIQKFSPQLIFLDINLSDSNGIDVSKAILQGFSTVKVILLTMYADEQMLKEAQKIGVHGYILKNSSKQELLTGISDVMNNKNFFDPKVLKTVDETKRDGLAMKFILTEREKEIIGYVKDSLDSYQIAEKMHLSYFTVKTHRRNIHFKLGTKNTPELIKFANDNGF